MSMVCACLRVCMRVCSCERARACMHACDGVRACAFVKYDGVPKRLHYTVLRYAEIPARPIWNVNLRYYENLVTSLNTTRYCALSSDTDADIKYR